VRRSLLVLLALLAALSIASCGGDDGGDEGVDVGAFESCLEDDGLDVGREDEAVDILDAQPVALFVIETTGENDLGIPVPVQVAVFESEDDAKAAEETIGEDGVLGTDRSGAVMWAFPEFEDVGIDDELSSTLSSCAEDAS